MTGTKFAIIIGIVALLLCVGYALRSISEAANTSNTAVIINAAVLASILVAIVTMLRKTK